MKSKASMKIAARARWGLSFALGLGCLTVTGWFAQPGGGGGRSAPAARMGMVRLTSPAEPVAHSDARVGSRASWVAAPAAPALSGMKANDRRERHDTAQTREAPAQPALAPAMENPTLAMGAPSQSEENQSAGGEQSHAQGEDSPASARQAIPAAAHPRGQPKGVAATAAANLTPYVQATDRARARTGAAERELEADQLDAGFGTLRQVQPGYPPLAKRLGKAGRVRLELAIDAEGRVYRINVLDETGGWGFGPSAASAYRNARFTRPTVRGRPVRVLWRKTVIFRP